MQVKIALGTVARIEAPPLITMREVMMDAGLPMGHAARGLRARPTNNCNTVKACGISVTVDDETYKRARVAAAERDTSVSALVKAYLEQLASHETEIERLKRQEREIRRRMAAFNASDRLSREDLHTRSQ